MNTKAKEIKEIELILEQVLLLTGKLHLGLDKL